MTKNYYSILGLERTASLQDIKRAYRRLAMKYHPDKNANKKDAENKFKDIREAYDILKDKQKRAAYDHYEFADAEKQEQSFKTTQNYQSSTKNVNKSTGTQIAKMGHAYRCVKKSINKYCSCRFEEWLKTQPKPKPVQDEEFDKKNKQDFIDMIKSILFWLVFGFISVLIIGIGFDIINCSLYGSSKDVCLDIFWEFILISCLIKSNARRVKNSLKKNSDNNPYGWGRWMRNAFSCFILGSCVFVLFFLYICGPNMFIYMVFGVPCLIICSLVFSGVFALASKLMKTRDVTEKALKLGGYGFSLYYLLILLILPYGGNGFYFWKTVLVCGILNVVSILFYTSLMEREK